MSAVGIKIETTTSSAVVASLIHEDVNDIATTIETKCANFGKCEEESSFCNVSSLKEVKLSKRECIVPLEISAENVKPAEEKNVENSETAAFNNDSTEFSLNQVQENDIENSPLAVVNSELSLLQQKAATSSPPPHSYRHSRAYRHFKNPPQPHMCIRTTNETGEELFINVLSWTRIVIPQEPSDPIPLYGGMRVPPGSPRSPPIVFAVMANPEVLKDSGRHSKDPEERRAMVELMCDFVEAMNPGVKLVRNAVILKDRDISGELKDVWNAVQAQRDREREEQMLIQRQQHFHNLANGSIISTSSNNSDNNVLAATEHMLSKSLQNSTVDDSMVASGDKGTPPRSRKIIHEVQNVNASIGDAENEAIITSANDFQVPLDLVVEHFDNKVGGTQKDESFNKQQSLHYTNNALNNGNIEDSLKVEESDSNKFNAIICTKGIERQPATLINGSAANFNDTDSSLTVTAATSTPNTNTSIPAQKITTKTAPSSTAQQAPTKREKLGGFLPNGCIFPRFTKSNKHKDKEKDKDKEPKTKDKEKNALLSALKKSKDKKSNATAANQDEKITSSYSNTTTSNSNQTNKQQKNCLQQLECGVQKLDLNNHHNHTLPVESHINNTVATITNNTSATSKCNSNTTTTKTGGVSVH